MSCSPLRETATGFVLTSREAPRFGVLGVYQLSPAMHDRAVPGLGGPGSGVLRNIFDLDEFAQSSLNDFAQACDTHVASSHVAPSMIQAWLGSCIPPTGSLAGLRTT